MTHHDADAREMERLTTQLIAAAEHWYDVLQICERGSVLGATAEDLDDWTTTARAELSRTVRAYRPFRDQTLRRRREEQQHEPPPSADCCG